MPKKLSLILVLLLAVVVLVGPVPILVSWIQEYTGNSSGYDLIRNILELVALLIYTYFGIRFFNRHIDSFR